MKKTSNKNSANGYCPLDQNKLIPNSNIPQLSFSNLTNTFNIEEDYRCILRCVHLY